MIDTLDPRSLCTTDGDIRPLDDDPDFVDDPAMGTGDERYESEIAADAHQHALDVIREIGEQAGPSVDLGVRALALIEALDEYAAANKLTGFAQSGKPIRDEKAVDQRRREHLNKGTAALRTAFGYDAMVTAGVDPIDVDDDFIMARYAFKKTYLNQKDTCSARRRAVYKRKLSEY